MELSIENDESTSTTNSVPVLSCENVQESASSKRKTSNKDKNQRKQVTQVTPVLILAGNVTQEQQRDKCQSPYLNATWAREHRHTNPPRCLEGTCLSAEVPTHFVRAQEWTNPLHARTIARDMPSQIGMAIRRKQCKAQTLQKTALNSPVYSVCSGPQAQTRGKNRPTRRQNPWPRNSSQMRLPVPLNSRLQGTYARLSGNPSTWRTRENGAIPHLSVGLTRKVQDREQPRHTVPKWVKRAVMPDTGWWAYSLPCSRETKHAQMVTARNSVNDGAYMAVVCDTPTARVCHQTRSQLKASRSMGGMKWVKRVALPSVHRATSTSQAKCRPLAIPEPSGGGRICAFICEYSALTREPKCGSEPGVAHGMVPLTGMCRKKTHTELACQTSAGKAQSLHLLQAQCPRRRGQNGYTRIKPAGPICRTRGPNLVAMLSIIVTVAACIGTWHMPRTNATLDTDRLTGINTRRGSWMGKSGLTPSVRLTPHFGQLVSSDESGPDAGAESEDSCGDIYAGCEEGASDGRDSDNPYVSSQKPCKVAARGYEATMALRAEATSVLAAMRWPPKSSGKTATESLAVFVQAWQDTEKQFDMRLRGQRAVHLALMAARESFKRIGAEATRRLRLLADASGEWNAFEPEVPAAITWSKACSQLRKICAEYDSAGRVAWRKRIKSSRQRQKARRSSEESESSSSSVESPNDWDVKAAFAELAWKSDAGDGSLNKQWRQYQRE